MLNGAPGSQYCARGRVTRQNDGESGRAHPTRFLSRSLATIFLFRSILQALRRLHVMLRTPGRTSSNEVSWWVVSDLRPGSIVELRPQAMEQPPRLRLYTAIRKMRLRRRGIILLNDDVHHYRKEVQFYDDVPRPFATHLGVAK